VNDPVVYCPGCGHKMERQAAHTKKWICRNPDCDIIELTFSWDYSSITKIKRTSKRREKPAELKGSIHTK